MNKMRPVKVIGGGLAGCESAYALAERGVPVELFEMKSLRKTEAHKSELLAELVCSNSFRGKDLSQGVGLLKEELRRCGSLFMEAALASSVPAGGAMAVDRDLFSGYITEKIRNHPLIKVVDEEVPSVNPEVLTIIATGPLTDGALLEQLKQLLGEEFCYFFDGSAPIVAADSIDYDKVFYASRYDKGDPMDYLNSPMDSEQYARFYRKLMESERSIPHLEGEREKYFEGCMPIEEMARRGEQTLLFGPLKPVGLSRNGERYHAVVQLRAENLEKTMFNLVGFQTGLTFGAQKELIHLLPGLEDAEILRYGVVHRNSFINSPRCLTPFGNLKDYPNLFIAGQFSGVEGYVESAASGFVCGVEASRVARGLPFLEIPEETMIGSLMRYISEDKGGRRLEPMNANFGLLPPYPERIRDKKEKKRMMAELSLGKLEGCLPEFSK